MDYCGEVSPWPHTSTTCTLAKGHRSIRHQDARGAEWSDPGQMSGDRPREVVRQKLETMLEEWDESARDSGPSGAAYESCAKQLREILE